MSVYLDIIYLNKQRLKAVEELNRMSEENRLLRDHIEQLEAEKQSRFGKGYSRSVMYCEQSHRLWFSSRNLVHLICKVVYILPFYLSLYSNNHLLALLHFD